jgi:uncharacterized repeat protein (TIGR02543 family)
VKRFRSVAILTALVIAIAACTGPTPPEEEKVTLTVNVAGDGTGTVTFDSAAGDSAEGATEHDKGTVVTLVATATGGSTFVGWSGDCTGLATTCQVTMDSDKDVTANFDPAPPAEVQLSVAFTGSTGSGRVVQAELGIDCEFDAGAGTSGPDCGPVTASATTAYEFEATPGTDMVFDGWGGDADAQCDDGSNTCTVTPDKDPFVVVALFRDPAGPEVFTGSVAVGASGDDGLEWVDAANTGEPEHAPGYTHSTLAYSGLAYVNRYEAEVINEFIFRGLEIPAGATITNAYIQFTSINRAGADHIPSDGSSEIELLITAEASSNPATIPHESNSNPISTRPVVGASVTWSGIANWPAKGVATAAQQTADIKDVLQAVVDLDGWDEGSDVGIIIKNNDSDASVGFRQIATYEEGADYAPVLHFTYTLP